VPQAARAGAVAELLRLIRKNGMHLATGFVGTPYLLDVLEDNGHLDVAYALLEQESFPSWLFPVKNGATTIWERWDSWTPERGFHPEGMNSFNHYAYGAVGAWMMRSLAGIDLDPAAPGYARIVFRPRLGGSIRHATATLATPHGTAEIQWRIAAGDGGAAAGERLSVRVCVPEGAQAVFSAPEGWRARNALPAALPAGESVLELERAE